MCMCIQYPELLLSLIICNVPHPITLGEARQSSLLQLAKQWYVAWFQVSCDWWRDGHNTHL